MTREEQIIEYANSFKGKGMESDELKGIVRLAIIDGAKWADNHPIKFSLPSDLDEAIEEYVPDFSNDFTSKAAVEAVRDAFKAGAEWMAKQGVTVKRVFKKCCSDDDFAGPWSQPMIQIESDGVFSEGEEVIVQIRKK